MVQLVLELPTGAQGTVRGTVATGQRRDAGLRIF